MNPWAFKWLTEAFLSDQRFYKTKEGKVVRYDRLKPGRNAVVNALTVAPAALLGGALGSRLAGGTMRAALRDPLMHYAAAGAGAGGGVGAYFGGKMANKKLDQRVAPNLKKLGAKEITKDEYKAHKKLGNKMGGMQRLRIFNQRPENFKG